MLNFSSCAIARLRQSKLNKPPDLKLCLPWGFRKTGTLTADHPANGAVAVELWLAIFNGGILWPLAARWTTATHQNSNRKA